MAGELEIETGGADAGSGTAPLVAERQPETPAPVVAAGNSALASVPNFGGIRGGKERLDGHIPGSVEAIEADKLYGRIRKFRKANPGKAHHEEHKVPAARLASIINFGKREHAAKTKTLRNPVPASVAPEPPPLPGEFETARRVDSPAQTIPVVDGDPNLSPVEEPVARWNASEIKELSDEIIELIEDGNVGGLKEKLKRVPNLPPDLYQEISQVANWPVGAKQIFKNRLPRVLEKWLNA